MKPSLPCFVLSMIVVMQCCLLGGVLSSSSSEDFDFFFFFVLQWPGAYCNTKQHCCYPKSGKPAADFGIHGLWPNYNDGSYPSNCNPGNSFNKFEISDLMSSLDKGWPTLACPSGDGVKFWTHEWEKHGTCSESQLDQHDYFETALELKKKTDLLQTLKNAGIKPDNEFYKMESIKEVIKEGIGYEVGIECNHDASGNSQLYQVFICVDKSGTEFFECPTLPRGRCASKVQFPSF